MNVEAITVLSRNALAEMEIIKAAHKRLDEALAALCNMNVCTARREDEDFMRTVNAWALAGCPDDEERTA
jgi:hypothetical protein